MTSSSPELFRFSNKEDYSNVSSDVWKISTPSLPWSIILSYLISSEELSSWTTNYELLSEVKSLKGLRKINNTNLQFDENSIRNSVQEFNPFLRNPSIYSDKQATVLLKLVHLKLCSFAIENATRNDEFLIKAAAKMLKCQIVVITDCSGTTNVTSYGEVLEERVPKLVLFLKKEIENGAESVVEYAFGMNLQHSASLRSDAMKYLFGKAEVDCDDICQIEEKYKELQETCIPFNDNFLLGILADWKHIVPNIYRTPYIAWELASAGFNTDPCYSEIGGLSAFGFCLIHKNSQLFRMLYNYAVNNFVKCSDSVRNPSKNIVESLKAVSLSLKRDHDIISKVNENDSCGVVYKNSFKTIREILYFNEYQSNCVEKMYKILETETQIETQRKRIVLSFLSEYLLYFYCQSNVNPNLYEDHIENIYYYENIDSFTCLLFFDKILFLNPGPNFKIFKNTVQNLFMTVLSYNTFSNCKDQLEITNEKCSECEFTSNNIVRNVISFDHRKSLKVFLQQYIENLKKDRTDDLPNINESLRNVRLCLQDFPDITDEILTTRLMKYLKTAIEFRFDEEDEDFVDALLVFERTLQVIGETLHSSAQSKSVVGHLISSCFPNEIVHELISIRNQFLSHYCPNVMHGRLHLKIDINKIRNFQKALADMNYELNFFYLSQQYRIDEFLISKSENACRKISSEVVNHILKKKQDTQSIRKEKYLRYINEIILLFHCILNSIQSFVENDELEKLNEFSQISSSLKFVLNFVIKQCDSNAYNQLLHYVDDLDILLSKYNKFINQLRKDVLQNVQEHRKKLTIEFTKIKDIKISGKKYAEFFNYLKNKGNFKMPEEVICDVEIEVQEHLKRSNNTKQNLINLLTLSRFPKENEDDKQIKWLRNVKKLVSDVFMSNENKNTIIENSQTNAEKTLEILENINVIPTITFKDVQEIILFAEMEEGTKLLLTVMKSLIESDKYQKENATEKYLYPINFILLFLEHIRDVSTELCITEATSNAKKIENLFSKKVKKYAQLTKDVNKNILEQRNILSKVFPDSILYTNNLNEFSSSSKFTCDQFSYFQHSFKSIRLHFQDVKNYTWFSDKELSDIETSVKKRLDRCHKTSKSLIEFLETNPSTWEENAKNMLDDLCMSIKNKSMLLKLKPIEALKKLKNKKSINKQITFIDLTTFSETQEGIHLLLNLKLPDGLCDKMFQFLNRNLESLLNRINRMRVIMIEDDQEIIRLWKSHRSTSEFQKDVRYTFIHNYMNDMNVRLPLEMLLFDCMNILSSREDLKDVWTKATNLFSGVNLRDLLAHGNTVLEVVGKLDPEDMPTQIIDTILELIEDGEVLKEVSDHWRDTRTSDLNELKDIVKKHVKNKKLNEEKEKEEMKKWNGYLSLLPLK